MLPRLLGEPLEKRGFHFVNGRGQPQAYDVIAAFVSLGISVRAVLDNEDFAPERRRQLGQVCKLFVWEGVRNIEEALCRWLSLEQLHEILELAADLMGIEERFLVPQVNDLIPEESRRSITPCDWKTLRVTYSEDNIRAALCGAMLRKKKSWFKTFERGHALGEYLNGAELPADFERQLERLTATMK